MSKPTLGYWEIRGYGQPIRALLAYLGVDYNEKFYKDGNESAGWFDEKFKLGLEFPNIPYWIDGDVKMTEKFAILKYLSRKYKNGCLMPSGDDLWRSDMLEGVLTNLWDMMAAVYYTPSDEAETNLRDRVPQKLNQLNDFIGDKAFCLGNTPMYVDFVAYEIFYELNALNKSDLSTKYPNIIKLMKNFEALPPIKEFMNSPNF